jgi:hypothetical protein
MVIAGLDTRNTPARASGSGRLLPPPIRRGRPAGRARRHRVMMYSHDRIGLGHMRRNANIATKFVQNVGAGTGRRCNYLAP